MTTETEWAARVEAWRASGLTAREYCENKEYTTKRLWYWSSRLQNSRRGQSDAPRHIVSEKVRIAKLVRAPVTVAAEPETPIKIELGEARLEVRRGFDRSALREILDVLGGMR